MLAIEFFNLHKIKGKKNCILFMILYFYLEKGRNIN